ncbi:hypothetical protein JCM5353_005456 [Sporobolomyces roseus]
MTPINSSPRKVDPRREHIQINVSTNSTPTASRDSSPSRSLSSRLIQITPPTGNTFDLRSGASGRNSPAPTPNTRVFTPTTTPRLSSTYDSIRGRTGSVVRQTSGIIVNLGRKALDSLWVQDQPPRKSNTPRLHGDDDLPPHLRSPSLDSTKRPLSRFGQFIVLCLLVLGLRELIGVGSSVNGGRKKGGVKVEGRNPFSVLKDLKPPSKYSTSIPSLDSVSKVDTRNSIATEPQEGAFRGGGDVTAVLLHWKRTENVGVILASLCQYDFIDSIVIWNNNPDIILTHKTFASSLCPASKLRIHNSPRNLLFFARYLACMQASTPYCFFQDDDWLLQPMRSLYAQFKRDPEGSVVVSTNSEVAVLYGLEWCFFQKPLHTCFTWVGTGAFTSRSHVAHFLQSISTLDYPREELAHADNSFTTFLNRPPYVMSHALTEMKYGKGHSDGNGILRNKDYIQKGLQHFVKLTHANLSTLPSTAPLPSTPFPVDVSSYHSTRSPPLAPHPYSHHTRSPCLSSDTCFFLTNLALLPPPDATPYPGPNRVKSLTQWENHVGFVGRGWIEGDTTEMWREEERWSLDWSYEFAVDGDPKTAFRSPDVAKKGDYVGLGLIKALDPVWTPTVSLHFILEDVEQFLPRLTIEVSFDGYHWVRYAKPVQATLANTGRSTSSCVTTNLRSTRPDLSFPNSRLLSTLASTTRQQEQDSSSTKLGEWWERRKRRGEKLRECKVEISSEGGDDGRGWSFIRLVIANDMDERELKKGWAVYEIWLKAGT